MSLLVGLGGCLGAVLRFLLGQWLTKRSTHFPWGTWMINISGSMLFGWFTAYHLLAASSHAIWLFVGIGFLGAYTTMSTFGYETVQLITQGKVKMAVFYVFSSAIIGIAAAWMGWLIFEYLFH